MWTNTNKIFFIGVAFNSFRMLIGATSAMFLLSKGMSFTEVGAMKTLQAIVILFADIPLGYFADKKSRKGSILASMLFASLWLFTTAIGDSKALLYLAEVFNSLSIALLGGAFTAYLLDIAKLEKNESTHSILGQYQKYQFLTMGIAALLGCSFVSIDSNIVWKISGIAILGLFCLSCFILPQDISSVHAESSNGSFGDDFRAIKKNLQLYKNEFKCILFQLLLASTTYQILIQFWQPLSDIESFAIGSTGIQYGIAFCFILIVQSKASSLASKTSNTQKIISNSNFASFAILILSIFISIFAKELLAISVILIFAVNRYMTVGLQGSFHKLVEDKHRATAESIFSTLLRAVLIFGMPTIGFFLGKFGIYPLLALLGTSLVYGVSKIGFRESKQCT